ncbi:MAG: hypothetical protein II225_03655 [Ruminococcus sp.]|nr:hypothetical protein [Ruminococcus sp.]
MRKANRSGNFLLCFLFNIFLNIELALPGIVLLALHFWAGLSVWYSVAAFALWIVTTLFWMKVIVWARKCGDTPDKPKENKNPYSSGQNKESV